MENEKLDNSLTEKERKILCLVARGKNNGEIAAIMNLSNNSIKAYISSLLQKLSVANRVQMAVKAIRDDLI